MTGIQSSSNLLYKIRETLWHLVKLAPTSFEFPLKVKFNFYVHCLCIDTIRVAPVVFEAVYYNVKRKSRLETVERQTIVLLSVQ